MNEYPTHRLEELCSFVNGGAWSDKEYVASGIPVLKVTNCKTSGFSIEEISFLPFSAKEKYSKNKLELNDVIIATVGSHPNLVNSSAGRSCIVNSLVEGFYLNQNAVCIRTNDDNILNQQYFGYYSKYYIFQNYIQMRGKGAANQMRIAIGSIKEYPMPLPPIDTQRRIASILSRYDSLIENYQKQIKLLEEAALRLYQEWFIDLHFPGHESTTIIDGVPEGWEIVTINEVTSKVTTGLNPRKNFVLGNGDNYYVTIKNMANNTIYLDDKCDKVDDNAIEKINKRSDLKTGDILFSGIGTIGRVCLIDVPTNNWNVSESVFTLRANDLVSKEFMYLMLLSADVQNYCKAHAHGAAQKGIRMADLKAYKFPLAPLKLMKEFTSKITPYINNVSRIQSQLRLLTEARDRLLPKLMSGEIEV